MKINKLLAYSYYKDYNLYGGNSMGLNEIDIIYLFV